MYLFYKPESGLCHFFAVIQINEWDYKYRLIVALMLHLYNMLWAHESPSVWYGRSSITVFIISLLKMIPAGCGARTTSSSAVTPGATGKPPERGSGPRLDGVTVWGVKCDHYQWQTWLSFTFFYYLFIYFSLLMFQGIYSHAVDPVQRRGNSQPDLLNVKAQKDAYGWYRHSALNTNRVHGKTDINTPACKLMFSDTSKMKQL